MRVPLRLSAIEQEHLQELYNATGVARDELPYTAQFDQLWQDFHNRTFKNADREQVFAAILRYVKSSSCSAGEVDVVALSEEQAGRIKDVVRRHSKGGRLLPYSSEFEAALADFTALTKTTLSLREFWLAICQAQGRPRRAPRRVTTATSKPEAPAPEAFPEEGNPHPGEKTILPPMDQPPQQPPAGTNM
ncbi:MAG: hypothetical protein ACM359_05955 [Bacillota bacterium]